MLWGEISKMCKILANIFKNIKTCTKWELFRKRIEKEILSNENILHEFIEINLTFSTVLKNM